MTWMKMLEQVQHGALIQIFTYVKWRIVVRKFWMTKILGAKDYLINRNLPVDAEGFVLDGDAAVGFRRIEVVTLVLEDCGLAENGKAMGEAARDEELAVVVFTEFYSNMTAVSRRAFADVYCDIENPALDTAHELALSVRRLLEMKSAHNSVGGHAFVVLDKIYRTDLLVEFTLGERLEKVAPVIFKDFGLYDYDTVYRGFDYFHKL